MDEEDIDTNLVFDWIEAGFQKDFPCPNATLAKSGNTIYIEGVSSQWRIVVTQYKN